MIRSVAIAVLTVLSATAAAAQVVEDHETAHTLRSTSGAARPAATLADMTWLVGRWKGTGLGGVSEEIFLALQQNGKVREERFELERQ